MDNDNEGWCSGSWSELWKRSAPPHSGFQSPGFTDPQTQVRRPIWGSIELNLIFAVTGLQRERGGGGEVHGATYCWSSNKTKWCSHIFCWTAEPCKNRLFELFVQLHVSLSRQRAPMWWCWNPMWSNRKTGKTHSNFWWKSSQAERKTCALQAKWVGTQAKTF